MVEYEIRTKKFSFGDNKFEKDLSEFDLKLKRIITDGENLIYEVERERDLTVAERAKIAGLEGVSQVAKAD